MNTEAAQAYEETAIEGGTQPSWVPKTEFGKFLDRWFKISNRGSTPMKEFIGGLTTFLAMFYILPVNSFMLNSVGAPLGGIFAATAISAGLTTLLMGIYANFPVSLASGMGVNAMITYTVCLGQGFTYGEALAMVIVDGILFLIVSVTPLRKMIVDAIPRSLKIAIGAGIGFFIAFIGLKNAGIIVADADTAVAFGDLTSAPVITAVCGIALVLILSALPKTNKITLWISRFAVIIALLVMGVIAASLGQAGVADMPTFDAGTVGSVSDISQIFGLCFKGFSVFARPEAYAITFALLFVDFFDTTGTLVAVEEGAGMFDEKGVLKYSDKPAMISDAIGTCIGAVCGTTTVTSFVESTTGVSAGARTGLASVFTGAFLLLAMVLYPALGMFSSVTLASGLSVSPVTSLALVYVGVCMFKQLKGLNWDDHIALASGFITILVMILAYSISDGIAWGFISYTVMSLASWKLRKHDIPVYVIAVLFIILYAVKSTNGLM